MFCFFGKYFISIDDKGRIVIPSQIKKEMGDQVRFAVTVEKDLHEKCLNVYPQKTWEVRLKQIKSAFNINNSQQSRMLDVYYQNIALVAISDKGRINIPVHLIDCAELVKDVIVTGQGDRFRIWSALSYEQSVITDEDYSRLMETHLGGLNDL